MEEIQFFNYLFSIGAFLLAAWAFYSVFKQEDKYDKEIEDLKYKISLLKEASNGDRKR